MRVFDALWAGLEGCTAKMVRQPGHRPSRLASLAPQDDGHRFELAARNAAKSFDQSLTHFPPDDVQQAPSEERLAWIPPKSELDAAEVRVVGFSVQTHVHGCEVNVSPGSLNRMRGRKARRSAHATDHIDCGDHELGRSGEVA